MEALRNIEIPVAFIVNFDKIQHLFLVIHCWIWGSAARCIHHYETCMHKYKLCHINHNQIRQSTTWKKPVSNLKSMQSVGSEQTYSKYFEIFVL